VKVVRGEVKLRGEDKICERGRFEAENEKVRKLWMSRVKNQRRKK